MDIQTIALGIVQGLTEFVPVSSSGHLVLMESLFGDGGENVHLFIEALNFGTVLALLIFFRHKILQICRQVFHEHNYVLLRNIVLTSLPVGIAGLLFSHAISQVPFFVSPITVTAALFFVGVIMVILEKLPKLTARSSGEKLSWKRALGIGFAQTLALVPGVSRSGSTIIAGRLAGLKPKQAAEYSFLVSIPVMLGLSAKLVVSDTQYLINNWSVVLVGNVAAFITGILAIQFLLDFLSKHSLKVFGVYRIFVAVVVILLIVLGVIQY
ncbi:undecaprenyl-diphosphate phosphatase [Candidatus Saccharibacteria bacterium]|nr:undecaprenyl-diphosphate phosphatase [Candidatus Saccharibacteria bacterium]